MARVRKRDDTKHQQFENPTEIIWKIAIYVRLSKEDEKESLSESIINQKKILIEYLETKFVEPYTLVDCYVDDGLSGTDDTRGNFMRMRHDIETGMVNCVLCKALDRSFRNYADQGYYLEYFFPLYRVRFICLGNPAIDTFLNPDMVTGLEVPITGLMNDRFAAMTSNKIRSTFNMKRRKGEFIGAFPPYGFLKDPANKNRLILDPDIVPIKRQIMGWIVNDGMSLNGVALKLNGLGIPNPTAYKHGKGWNYANPQTKQNDGLWSGSTVGRMLLNLNNVGHMVQGKQRVVSYKVHDREATREEDWFIVQNTHEPTFTQEEFNALAQILSRDTRTPNGKHTVHLFSGFLRCAQCNKAMRRCQSKDNVYYICRTYSEKSKMKCSRRSLREDCLYETILAAVQAQILLLDSFQSLVNQVQKTAQQSMASKLFEKMLFDQTTTLEKAIRISDGLYADWKEGDITREEYLRMKENYHEQIRKMTDEIKCMQQEQLHINRKDNDGIYTLQAFLTAQGVQSLDRAILAELLDVVWVHEGKNIIIQFQHTDPIAWAIKHTMMMAPPGKPVV